MSEINLIVCPEGGEHAWELWYDEDNNKLIIDCDCCHQVGWTEELSGNAIPVWLTPLPVQLERVDNQLKITARREV